MPRKLLSGVLSWACVAFALARSASAQQQPKIDLEVSSQFLTQYIWNGFNRVESYGLESGPVIQPGVTIGMEGTPLHVHVGGSFVMNDQSELHEMVYGVHVERWTAPMTRLYLGYNYFDDRVRRPDGVPDLDGHELWGGLEIKSAIGTRTSLMARWENPAQEGFDPYTVLVGTLGFGKPIIPSAAGTLGLNLDLHTRVLYNTAIKQLDAEVVRGGFSAWQAGLGLELKAGPVAVTPSVDYQMTFEDAVNDEDPIWAGVNLAYNF